MSKKILIEGAQAYSENIDLTDINNSLAIALRVVEFLSGLGFATHLVSLFDDTSSPEILSRPIDAPKDNNEHVFSEILQSLGWKGVIVKESSLYIPALEFLNKIGMTNRKWFRSNKGTGNYLKNSETGQRIKVMGKQEENYPSCQLLDAAFYIKKIRDCGLALTVINNKYYNQQEDVKLLLQIYYERNNIPVIIVYYDEDGGIMNIDSWSDSNLKLSKVIRNALIC